MNTRSWFKRPRTLAPLILSGLLLFSPSAKGADSAVTVQAGPAAGDLVCPDSPAKPPHPPEADLGQIPTSVELGALARPVVREQPVIDPSVIPGFVLDDASGPRPRRIAVWGDSHAAAGPFMPTVVERLQSHGVTVATRFLAPSMGRANVRLPALHAYCIGPGWSTELAYTARDPLQVGPGLMNRIAEAGPDSYLWLDLRGADRQAIVRQVQVVYRTPEGARLEVSVNDGPEQEASLPAGPDSQTLSIRPTTSISTLKLRISQGRIVLHGFILDYLHPPLVTFDVFGVPSATAQGWANLDPAYLKRSLHGEDYDAVALEYGANEGSDLHFDPDRYAAGLTAAMQNLRQAFPKATCLLIGPPDRGVLVRRRGEPLDLLSYSRNVQRIEAAQSQIGARFGCAHWNWQALMGGEGGSYGWARREPPLMGPDLTHLTPSGYKLTGEALAHSLGF